jgi:uncharacterized protein
MIRFVSLFSALVLGLFLSGPAAAQCMGQNILDGMDPDRRAKLQAATDAVPFARGNFWRATRGDEVITIAGTYHFDDPRHFPSFEALAPLIASARTVLVEAGPDEDAALMDRIATDPSALVITDGPLLNALLPAEVWAPLSDAMSARGIPAFMTAKFQPWYVLTLLSIPPCAMLQMESKPKGLDGLVIDAALAAGVPVRGLEPYDTLFKIFGQLSTQDLTDLIASSLAIEPQSEDYFTTLVDSYFVGESRMAWELMRFVSYDIPGYTKAEIDAEFARMEEIVSSSRNRVWIPVLTGAAAEGPVFTAFGALHLSGEDGVLNLLQKEGFVVEPLKLP